LLQEFISDAAVGTAELLEDKMYIATCFYSDGIGSYAADHDQTLPNVATAAGSPWWKVGDQGLENQSNTRHLWLLVQGNMSNLRRLFVLLALKAKRLNLTAHRH